MYILGVRDYISVLVRVDSVQTLPNRYTGRPELCVIATLRLSPNADKDREVLLWATVDDADVIKVDKDFVARDVQLEGHCAADHDNPYARAHVGISAIWFDEEKKHLALVRERGAE
jgi:hypothetical protein